jgi:type IV pilus assembly protein PilA
MLAKLKGKRGFTLVELMIVVAIIGVLAALAIYGVRKYIANAKTAEARMTIGRIAKDASAAYNRENMPGDVLALGAAAAVSNRLCSDSAAVPTDIASVKGKKYQSNPTDWAPVADAATVGWKCLKFSMQDPQYYMYQYKATGSLTDGVGTFTAYAWGDLNGDTNTSQFALSGAVDATTKVVRVAPNIAEEQPEE